LSGWRKYNSPFQDGRRQDHHRRLRPSRADETKNYRNRDEARQDVFEHIELFYNPKRKHVRNGRLSPVEFERQQKI